MNAAEIAFNLKVNDFGGIGFEFYSTVVKPYFEKLREKGEEAGGSRWDARKKKSRSEFLPVQRVSNDSASR